MANYNETVLYSSRLGTANSFTLSGNPSAYDYLKISYGSPVIGRTASALGNLGPMMTVNLPTSVNYANLYSNFYGTVSTTDFYTPYRACASFSGTSGSSWSKVFNRYGTPDTVSAVTNAAWTHIYSVVGVTTGTQGSFHCDLLFDAYRDGTAKNITLTAHPSAYRRIGIIVGLPPTGTSDNLQSVKYYQEYPYFHLTNASGRSGYIITYSKYVDNPVPTNNLYQGGLYSGCYGTTWNLVGGRFIFETGGNGGQYVGFGRIHQVIGIDRI